VAEWTPDTYRDHANEAGPSGSVAAKLLADPELRRILTEPQGREWLTKTALRQASVSFLLDQQRLSSLDTPEVNVRYDAFVSFHKTDRTEVLKIVDGLAKAGIKVFIDEDEMRPGDNLLDLIEEALSSSGALLFCFGANTPSTWQTAELQAMALRSMTARSTVRIIPILLPGSQHNDIPLFLQAVQWLDLRDGISQVGLDRLISAIRPVIPARR